MNGRDQAFTPRVLLTIVVTVAVLRLAQEVFIPLALAVLITFLLAPLIARLRSWGLPRTLAVIAAMLLALVASGLLLQFVLAQFADVARELPHYQQQLHENLLHLRGVVRGGVANASGLIEELSRDIQGVAAPLASTAHATRVQLVAPPATPIEILRGVVTPLLRPVGTAFVVIVLVGFMLLRLADLRERIIHVLGSRNLHSTNEALSEAAGRVSRYLLTQLLVNSWTGLAVGVGLWTLGIPHWGLWGTLVALLRFIPYVGIWMAAAIPFALSFAVFDDLTRPLLILGLVGAVDLANYVALEPWLYGHQTGISPVALLLAAAFWTWLWGGVGLFLSIPMTVCLVVMSKYIPQLEFLAVLLGDEPALAPHERLYQRLLANQHDEADALLHEARRSQSLLEIADAMVAPALRLLERDAEQGVVEAARHADCLQYLRDWADEQLESAVPAVAEGTQCELFCVPCGRAADAIMAQLLTAVLRDRGMVAELRALEQVPIAAAASFGSACGAIIVSALPPDALTRARAVCRAVQRRQSGRVLIAGLWQLEVTLARARERLEPTGAQQIVVSLAQCLAALDELRTAPTASTEEVARQAAFQSRRGNP